MKYFQACKIAFLTAAEYKFKLFTYSLIGVTQTLIYYFLWTSIYKNGRGFHYSLEEMITYVILSFLIQGFSPKWITMEIGRRVRNGDIVIDLLRPVSFIKYFFAYSLGDVAISFVFQSMPIALLIVFFIPIISCHNIVFFIASFALAYILSFLISYIIGLISFFTTNIWGIFTTFELVNMFISGALIPVIYMPGYLQKVFSLLPFYGTVQIPIDIYLGKYGTMEMSHALIFQLVWIAILYFVSRMIYRAGLKKLEILGG